MNIVIGTSCPRRGREQVSFGKIRLNSSPVSVSAALQSNLSLFSTKIASKLGYTQELWDADKVTECCKKYWEDLDKNQQEGAKELGYDQKSWNNYQATSKNKTYLLYLSHLCFVLGSIFYLRLALISIQWDQYIRAHHVPLNVLVEDDDDIWEKWSHENDRADILEFREDYWIQYERNNVLGAFSFAVMGLVELYWDRITLYNLLLPLGGLVGMANALQYDSSMTEYGYAVSLTLYLLSCTKLDLFFAGSAIECFVSYAYLAGYDEVWLLYLDLLACLIWLYCALVGVAAQFGFSIKWQSRRRWKSVKQN